MTTYLVWSRKNHFLAMDTFEVDIFGVPPFGKRNKRHHFISNRLDFSLVQYYGFSMNVFSIKWHQFQNQVITGDWLAKYLQYSLVLLRQYHHTSFWFISNSLLASLIKFNINGNHTSWNMTFNLFSYFWSLVI